MKRVISIVLICSLLFLNGCNNNNASKALKSAETYGYYSIANITYGMTFEDCCKAMAKTEKDFKLEIPTDEESKKYDTKVYQIDISLYGKNATLILYFEKIPQFQKQNINLTHFRIIFKEGTTKEFYLSELKKETETKKLLYQFSENSGCRNSVTISTLQDPKIKEKSIQILHNIFPPSNKSKLENLPLDSISIWPCQEVGYSNFIIEFIGTYAAIVNAAAR
ncbi:hypothetical protein RBG61_06830 [Paludicola sp. MB14-C6]|uniref:hypothetical protein n=1 Tax=Paludihabitans sp. MB14-C6 TaxID=3070656 RepID=UPI0027DE3E46|nr:hypothetical protein [Paludicola sp. MB14-C6]WMJ24376.1 hypothetical protein RBG61_06830 [Paludicola sp. MB14-C6]